MSRRAYFVHERNCSGRTTTAVYYDDPPRKGLDRLTVTVSCVEIEGGTSNPLFFSMDESPNFRALETFHDE